MPLPLNSRVRALAFAPSLSLSLSLSLSRACRLSTRATSFTSARRTPLALASNRALRAFTMTAGNSEDTVSTTPPVSISDTSGTEYSLDTDALKEKAMQVVSDVSERPLFYSQIAAYSAAAVIALTVLRAVISAVDSIPILPGVLELIGLSYTVWFFWRYVLFKESRQELLEEVEEFLGRARPQ